MDLKTSTLSDASNPQQTTPEIENSPPTTAPDASQDNTAANEQVLPSNAPEVPKIKTEEVEESTFARVLKSVSEEKPNGPSTANEIYNFKFHHIQAERDPTWMISSITTRMVNKKCDLGTEFPDGEEAILNLMSCIRVLVMSDSFSAQDEIDVGIRWILTTLMGENERVKGPYAYPLHLQLGASALLEAVDERLPTIEVIPKVEDEAGRSTSEIPRAHKRRRTNTRDQQRPKVEQRPLVFFDNTLKVVMRGIVDSGNDRRSYSIPDKSIVRSCNVVGDNGIAVGTWWPYRICALRDGAHGATMAGIAGGVNDGAYSIVVSGHYAELDRDNGNTLYYSGSKSHENEDPLNPVMTTSTRSLQTSRRENRSVRVLRAAGGNPRYSPSVGFRYDGLYKVIEEARPMNKKGGCYVRFTLVRKSGQAEIDLSRPNNEERSIFNRLKEV